MLPIIPAVASLLNPLLVKYCHTACLVSDIPDISVVPPNDDEEPSEEVGEANKSTCLPLNIDAIIFCPILLNLPNTPKGFES